MGFLITGDTEMQVYLTEYGKNKILYRSFVPASFSINDADVNYLTNQIMTKSVVDISGDYDDCVFSLSAYRNIKESIIKSVTSSSPPSPIAIEDVNESVVLEVPQNEV
jgi:hypothetical protein